MRVVVFASGGGSNFQTLIDRSEDTEEGIVMAGLVASRPGTGAEARARRHGIPVFVASEGDPGATRPDEARRLIERLDGLDADLIVLAGYLRLVPELLVRRWWGRIVNVHPALLPAFGGSGMYGRRVHEAVLASGARITGVTVHFVDERYDRGPIIAQWPVPVLDDDTPEMLARRVLEVEHRLLPDVVAALVRGDVCLTPDGQVSWARSWFVDDRFVMSRDGRT